MLLQPRAESMRSQPRVPWLVAAGLILCACAPDFQDTTYQAYEVILRGPVPAEVGPTTDPFVQTVTYRAIVNYFEDSAGLVPYGSSLRNPPAYFKGFDPTVTLMYPATQTSFPLTADGQAAALPRLSASQTTIYVASEIDGLDVGGNTIAKARCPIQPLLLRTGSIPQTVLCQPFFGFTGQWNQIRSPNTFRFDFAAAVLSDGRVVIGGGKSTPPLGATPTNPDQAPDLDSVEIFNPTATDPSSPGTPGVWQLLPAALSAGRSQLTATATTSGLVVFAGGAGMAGLASETLSAAVDIFDGSTVSMRSGVPPLPTAVAQHAAALLAGDVVYAGGGIAGALMQPATKYEVISATVGSTLGPTQVAQRSFPCMVGLPATSQVLMCGGGASSCELTSAAQSEVSGIMQTARGDVRCAAIGQSVYLVGGVLPDTPNTLGQLIEVWTNGTISMAGGSPAAALTNHGVAAAGSNLIVAGGYAQGNSTAPLNSGFSLNSTTGVITPLATMNNHRARYQLVSIPDGTVMAIGGLIGSDDYSAVGAEVYVPR